MQWYIASVNYNCIEKGSQHAVVESVQIARGGAVYTRLGDYRSSGLTQLLSTSSDSSQLGNFLRRWQTMHVWCKIREYTQRMTRFPNHTPRPKF